MKKKNFHIAILVLFLLHSLFSVLIIVMPAKVYAAVPNPQFLFTFNGDYSDRSGNEKPVVVGTGVSIITDPTRGKVLNLLGHVNSSHVTVTNTISGDFTKSAWVKLGVSPAGFYNIISNGTTLNNNSDFFWVANGTYGGTAFYTLKAGPQTTGVTMAVQNTTTFPTNTWTHVAVTYTAATKQWRLYQSGALVGIGTGTTASPGSTRQAIGAFAASDIANSSNWTGQIDDAQVWDSVLSDAQILEVMAQDNWDGVTPTIPIAPVGLATIYTLAGRVALRWTAVSAVPDVTDYQIEYKPTTGVSWNVFSDGTSTATSGLITSLITGMSYDFRVSAINASGTSAPSTPITATAQGVFVPEPQFLITFDGHYGDVSSYRNHATNIGTFTTSDPFRGTQVGVFSGSTSNYVSAPVPLASSGFTRAAWVLLASGAATNFRMIMGNDSSAGSTGSTFLWVSAGVLSAGHLVGGTPVSYASDPTPFTTGQWTHVAVSFDAIAKRYKLYKNGFLVGSGVSPAVPIVFPYVTKIGNYTSTFWQGLMDNAASWSGALTDEQIYAVYNGDYGVPVSTPLAPTNLMTNAALSSQIVLTWSGVYAIEPVTDYRIEYKFSTGSTRTVFPHTPSTVTSLSVTGLLNNISYDFRVSAINSLGTGTASQVATGMPINIAVPEPQFLLRFSGNFNDVTSNANHGSGGNVLIATDMSRGSVGAFNGTLSYVYLPVPLGTGGFTKAAWVFLTPGATMSSRNIIGNNNSQFFWVNSSLLNAGHVAGGVTTYVTDSTNFVSGSWVHVALTFDNTTKKYMLYRNGVFVASGTSPGVPPASTFTYIGTYNGNPGNNWSGYIDDAAMWNSSLTEQQIQAVYQGNMGIPIPTPWAPKKFSVRSVGSGFVTLLWSGVVSDIPVTDYQIEYKFSTGVSWNIFSDPVSTATTGTVTGLINNMAYDFKVSAINSAGIGSGSTIASAMPTNSVTYYHVLSNGQSLSVGYAATPILSTYQPYNNLALSLGDPQGSGNQFGPLIETGSVETPSAGIANSIRGYTGALSRPIIVGLHGVSAQPYAGLKKGTSAYAKGMAQASISKSLVEATGGIYKPLGVTIVHGETDAFQGLASLYESFLVEWQSDYQFDINSLMGTTGVVFPLFINQVNSTWSGDVPVAQLNAHKHNPGKIVLVGPKYQYAYTLDKLHLTNVASRHMGEMFAKVMKKVTIDGESWNPLMPTMVVRSGSIITVSYNIPVGPLNIDTGTVAQRTNYGFEFVQSGAVATISGVSLVSGNTQVQIVLSGSITGTNQKLRYAWSCPLGVSFAIGTCADASSSSYVGGNIRDSDNSVSPSIDSTTLPLYNWGVSFEEDVIAMAMPPNAPTNVTATGGNTEATVQFSGSTNSGGSAILYYIVTSSPGNIAVTGTNSPIRVTGLTNGVNYTFTVAAKNILRTGEVSSASNTVTPAGVPNAPTNVAATSSSGQATIYFSGSTSSGGSDILYYIVTSSPGNISYTGGDSPIILSGLTNGTSYTFTVRAVNGAGTGTASSASNSVTPATIPSEPLNVMATSASGQATIYFSGSANSGGSTILEYIAISSPGGIIATGSGTPIILSGLTNGISYTFTVVARNAIGSGSASSASNSVTPIAVANEPTNVMATSASGQATIYFSGSTYTGGSEILYYTVTSNPGNISATGSGTPIILSGLTNGTSYTFTVRAVNGAGTGTASSASNSVVPATIPSEPFNVMATSASGQATIYFSGSTNNGGSAILEYIVISSPEGLVATGSGTPIILSGLTNGVSYTFTVVARNAIGTGVTSSASNSVTPLGFVNEPTGLIATGSSGQAIVSFVVPTFTGGSDILYYVLTGAPGNIVLTGAGSPLTVPGLTNGTTYTFRIAAVNGLGTGAWSSTSNSIVPATVPHAPTSVSASASSGQATVSFTAPAHNGGSAILYYVVTSNTGDISYTGNGSPIILSGLTNGTTYTFTVVAVNVLGTGDVSAASNSVVPATVALAPTNIAATSASGQATIYFSGSTYDGGSPILYYIVSSVTGNIIATGSDSPILMPGLTNGTTYQFTVAARNAIGTGEVSSASNTVTPAGVPNAPTSVSASASSGQATVSFVAPTYTGGSAILYYVVTSNTGDISYTGSGSPIILSGLTNGVVYNFTVRAVNGAGTGTASSASNSVTPWSIPNAPTSVSASASSGQAIVSFTPSTYSGGSHILYYVVISSPGNIMTTGSGSPITITGLTNGSTYSFTVAARSAFGTGTASSASNSVTPLTVPHVPTNIQAAGTDGVMVFDFDPPGNNGGSSVLYYSLRSVTGALVKTGSGSPIILSGLFNGYTYTFSIAAVNAQGEGTSGWVSATVTTPTTAPVTPPTDIVAAAGSGKVTFTFGPPVDNGGLLIDYYTLRTNTGLLIMTGVNSPLVKTGLMNGSTYSFTLAAVNQQGEGPSGSVSATPDFTVMDITNITEDIFATYAWVDWQTNIPLTTMIQYGITTGYSLLQTGSNPSLTTTHEVLLPSLFACTTYHYRMIGVDADGYVYTGSDNILTTACTNNAPVLIYTGLVVEVPVGDIFTMIADIGTLLELEIPADVVTVTPELVFQGRQLSASTVLSLIGTPDPALIQVGALFDLQAYSGDTERVTNFDTGLTMTLEYRDQDIVGVEESTLAIYSYDGTDWEMLPGCVVDESANEVTCQTTHFSIFAIFGEASDPVPPPPSGGGGGSNPGGIIFLIKDICPGGDKSPSYYDNRCTAIPQVDDVPNMVEIVLQKCKRFTGEEMQSYCFAYIMGITNQPTFIQARYYDQITRAQLSKMMGEFAMKVLKRVLDLTKQCVFSGPDPDGLKDHMIRACQLGLMNTSRPNDVLTRGEYMTVLSRMLYGKTYEQTNVESEEHPFYEYHMEKLYEEGLINRREPLVKAQRFVPFLTLYRLAQKGLK